jgi:hypothetical protein
VGAIRTGGDWLSRGWAMDSTTPIDNRAKDRQFASRFKIWAKYRGKSQGRPVGTNHCKFLSSHPRVSDDGRGRAVDGGCQEVQPLRPSGRDYDPDRRHGLRASELCDLQWSQVELATGRLHVRRAKNGSPSVHPMQGDEIRALRRLQREQGLSSHIFMTERDGPMTPKTFHALLGRIGERAKMPFPVHPHMLRHGCGYALANAGHDTRALQAWLGHKNIQHTVRYTELAPDRFKNFWR